MFDESKTGIVATSHVENILAAVGIKVLPNEARDPILQLLANAESGKKRNPKEISFEELFSRIKAALRQRRDMENAGTPTKDGGPLPSLEWDTSSFMNWINPLRWMGEPNKSVMQDETAHASARGGALVTSRSCKDTGRRNTCRSAPVSVRSQRSILSEWMIKERNAQLAEEQRQMTRDIEEMRQEQLEHHLARAERLRCEFIQQQIDVKEADEALKATKRETGVVMRRKLQAAYQRVQDEKAARNLLVSAKTVEMRQAKAVETAARHLEKERTAAETAKQAAAERAVRKEETLVTKRAQAQAAKDYAARVRYETRPALAQGSRAMFQSQREAVCAAERAQQGVNREKRSENLSQFLKWARETVFNVKEGDEIDTWIKKRGLEDQKHRDADDVRQQLQTGGQRKRRVEDDTLAGLRDMRNAIVHQRFDPLAEDEWLNDAREREADKIRQAAFTTRSSLQVRSREWASKGSSRAWDA